jgi:hypothetical protein
MALNGGKSRANENRIPFPRRTCAWTRRHAPGSHARRSQDGRRAIDAGFESGDGPIRSGDALLDCERVFAGLQHATIGQSAQPPMV